MPPKKPPVAVATPVATSITVPTQFTDGCCACTNNIPICLSGCCCLWATTGQLYERVLNNKGTCKVIAFVVFLCLMAGSLEKPCQPPPQFDPSMAVVFNPPDYCTPYILPLLSALSFAGFVIIGYITCKARR